jgi:F0F1-type ATP synthase membrane subunit b/b'
MLFCIAVENSSSVFGIFENNLINWMVLIALLIWMGFKYIPSVLQTRKKRIESTLVEASKAKSDGLAFFNTQQKQVINAEKEAEHILVEAKQIAQSMAEEIELQTQKDLLALERKIKLEVENENRMAVTKLRNTVAKTIMALSKQKLPDAMNTSIRSRLSGQFIKELEANKS